MKGPLDAAMISRCSIPVIIIGASLAGSAAALKLAQQGIPSLLVDKARFPRRKACGEGLSGRGVAALLEAGLDVRTECRSWAPLEGYRIFLGERPFDIEDTSGMIGVQRAELDAALISRVRSCRGATVRFGKPVSSIERAGNRYVVWMGDERVEAESLVIADGAGSRSLAHLGFRAAPVRRRRVGSSSSWRVTRGRLSPFVQTFLGAAGEVYLTPTGTTTMNLSLLGEPGFVAQMSDPERLSQWLRERSALLGVECQIEAPPIGAGPLNTLWRAAVHEGALVAGDACESFDPIGGMGMTHAVLTGALAADAVTAIFRGGDREEALEEYRRGQAAAAQEMRGFTRMTSWMLGSPVGRVLMPLAVSSGVARCVADAAHGVSPHSGWGRLVRAVGC